MTARDDAVKVTTYPRRKRRTLARDVMRMTGREWCGSDGPPLANRSVYVKDDGLTRVFSMVDDGGFVGIGYPDEWQVIMRTKAARMFAWWTFKLWVGDWFGLRQWAYYTALHKVAGNEGRWQLWRPYGRRTRALTRWSSYDEWRKTRDGGPGGS